MRERFGEMAQREQRSVEDVGRGPVIVKDSVAEKIDLEARKLASPLLLPRLSWMTGSDEELPVEAIGRNGVRGPK